jgi:hypothetical protein
LPPVQISYFSSINLQFGVSLTKKFAKFRAKSLPIDAQTALLSDQGARLAIK